MSMCRSGPKWGAGFPWTAITMIVLCIFLLVFFLRIRFLIYTVLYFLFQNLGFIFSYFFPSLPLPQSMKYSNGSGRSFLATENRIVFWVFKAICGIPRRILL